MGSLTGALIPARIPKTSRALRALSPTTIAENRRNASLREIDRRRAVLGETLRRSVQEVENAEFEVIEKTPAKGKNAA